MNIYKYFRPLIFKTDAETAHNLAINFLHYLPNLATIFASKKEFPNLQQTICDVDFKSPIGMAAGFDKNAGCIKALHNFGFGFIEAGTVTPKAQAGNDKPRMFRLQKDSAIINRLGFNNKGADFFAQNILSSKVDNVLGINIGKNKDTVDAAADYLFLLEKFYHYASYITVNISSPNTKNLRDLQNEDQLDDLLTKLMAKKNELQKTHNKNTPLWLKIAPDLDREQIEKIAAIVLKNKIDAVIISNTTISRDFNLQSNHAGEIGGLSGKPLFEKSTLILRQFYQATNGQIPLIGVGGIANAQDAYTKIRNGASLVQIYSALIYQGFGMIEKMTQELSELVTKDGFENISEAVGVDCRDRR